MTLIGVVFFALFSSCVPMRRYEELERQNAQLQSEYESSAEQVKTKDAEVANLQSVLAAKDRLIQQLEEDLALNEKRYEDLDRTNRDLLERYDRILEQNRQMLETTSGEKQQLTLALAQKESELQQRERDLQQLERDLQSRSQRVAELENAIREKDDRLRQLREKVDLALRGFSDSDLSVEERNGRLYVSLSQNLLFPSGSKTINASGKSALASLATVLKNNPNIDITVEGHTDSDGESAFNWDLSVGRATTVVKELTRNGVSPERIIAAGRGEFYPVAPNSSASGKAQNRRTEIILTPDLDQLYTIFGGNSQ